MTLTKPFVVFSFLILSCPVTSLGQDGRGADDLLPLVEQTRDGVSVRIEKVVIDRSYYSYPTKISPDGRHPYPRKLKFFITETGGESLPSGNIPAPNITFANDVKLPTTSVDPVGAPEQEMYLRQIGTKKKIPDYHIGWILSYRIPDDKKIDDIFPVKVMIRTGKSGKEMEFVFREVRF